MEGNKQLKRDDLLYPDLSYRIVGVLFEVYNQLGSGLSEKYYQKAVANELKKSKIAFKEQVYAPLKFKEDNIGRHFLDFLIEDKIVLEIKKGERFSKRNIDQVTIYLKVAKKKLAILANFGPRELKFKRIINFDLC